MHTLRRRLAVVVVTVALITSASTAGIAPADAGTERPTDAQQTQLAGCGTISQPGTYVLASDITNSTADPCILINASHVVFDGDGHTIDGVGDSRPDGIVVSHPSDPLTNVTIRDVSVTDWDHGIESTGGGGIPENISDIRVAGVTARSNGDSGIRLSAKLLADATIVDSTVTDNADHGIEVSGEDTTINALLRNNTASHNDDRGITTSGTNHTLVDNTARNNTNVGIRVGGDGARLVANTATANGGAGIRTSSATETSNNTLRDNVATANEHGILSEGNEVTLANNTVRDNQQQGIGVGTFGDVDTDHNATIHNNTVTANGLGVGGGGIVLGPDTRNVSVTANTVTETDATGINNNGHDNAIRNNTVSNNSVGIAIDGDRNVVTNTLVTGSDDTGILVDSGRTNNTFADNHIRDNNGTGILLSSAEADWNVIDSNTVESNGGDGIRIERGEHNRITNSTASRNGGSGIVLTINSENNSIVDSHANGNSQDGLRIVFGSANNTVRNVSAISNSRWAASTEDAPAHRFTTLSPDQSTTVSARLHNVGLNTATPRVGDPAALQELDTYLNVSVSDIETEPTTAETSAALDIQYTDAAVEDLNESDLRMYRFTGGEWTQISGSNTVNTSRNVVSATLAAVGESTLVTIFDTKPEQQPTLRLDSVSPGVIHTPESYTVSLTGTGVSNANFELVNPSGQAFTPEAVSTVGDGVEVTFNLTTPQPGFWDLNATLAGQRAHTPVVLPAQAPLMEMQSSWPNRLVPGRLTELHASVSNAGTTAGRAILAVNLTESMQVRDIRPGPNGTVIENASGRVTIAQPVSPDATATPRVQFRLDPDRVIFPGQDPSDTRTVPLGERTVMGSASLVGTLTPTQWASVADQSASAIRAEARTQTADRRSRLRAQFNETLNGNLVSLSPINATLATDIVDHLEFLATHSPADGDQASSATLAGPAGQASSRPVTPAQTDGSDEQVEVYVALEQVDVTSGIEAWEDGLFEENGEPVLGTMVSWTEEVDGRHKARHEGTTVSAPDAPTTWNQKAILASWTECRPVTITLETALAETEPTIIDTLASRTGGLATVTGLGFGLAGYYQVLIGGTLATVGGIAAGGVGVLALVVGGAAYLNEAEFFGAGQRTIEESGRTGVETYTIDTARRSIELPDNMPDKFDKPREGAADVRFSVGIRETGESCDEESETQSSIDPNDISADPVGVGPGNHVTANQTLEYRVRFENLPNATAAARDVSVTVPIDPALEFDSIETQTTSHPSVMSVSTDADARTVTWEFSGIDLPPNETPPEGEGFVEFTAQPRTDQPTGTTITENASIQFEFNPPIETNESTHTIDTQAPTTSVDPLDSPQPPNVSVGWTGDDAGAGIDRVTLWAAPENESFEPVDESTGENFSFQAVPGQTYRLATTSVDRVGHVESLPDQADTTVTIEGATPRLPGFANPATNNDSDSFLEDVNGDTRFNINDVVALFDNRMSAPVQNNSALFNFNEDPNDRVNMLDVVALFEEFQIRIDD